MIKTTHSEFLRRVSLNNEKYQNGEFKIIGKYQGIKKPVIVETKYCKGSVLAKTLYLKRTKITLSNALDKDKYLHNILMDVNPYYAKGLFKLNGKFTNTNSPIECEDKYGLTYPRLKVLLAGYKPGIETAKDKTAYFLNKVNENNISNLLFNNTVYVKSILPMEATCPTQGTVKVYPSNLLRGSGCPYCIASKGERIIADYLIKNNIEYIPQKKFEGCRHKKMLPFDFYIPEHNKLVEFQGRQHFVAIELFGGEATLREQQHRDRIKYEWAESQEELSLSYIRHD